MLSPWLYMHNGWRTSVSLTAVGRVSLGGWFYPSLSQLFSLSYCCWGTCGWRERYIYIYVCVCFSYSVVCSHLGVSGETDFNSEPTFISRFASWGPQDHASPGRLELATWRSSHRRARLCLDMSVTGELVKLKVKKLKGVLKAPAMTFFKG